MKRLLILLFAFACSVVHAQVPLELEKPLAEIDVKDLDLISIDTRDQIFASTMTGDIYLFDQNGKQQNLFSPARQGRLSQLEASWTVNIFSFSTDLQEYRILDRFLNPLAENSFLLNGILLPKAATLGNNNVIWVWDESDLSLKSLDYLRNIVLQSQPLNLILNSKNLTVTEVREFKNRLFMNVPESGIYIFDNQGNFLQKTEIKGNQRMCFYKESLFWIEEGNLKRYDLATRALIDLGQVPIPTSTGVQIGREMIVLSEKNHLRVYPLPRVLRDLK